MSTARPAPDRTRLLRKVWRAMAPQDRTAAVRAAARGGHAGAVQALRTALLKALRMRPVTVQGWSPQQLADASARITLDEDLLCELLVAFHLAERAPLLTAFLDAAGVPHQEGVMDETASNEAPEPDRVLAAADQVLKRFPAPECHIYFATLLALEGGGWEPLRARIDAELLA